MQQVNQQQVNQHLMTMEQMLHNLIFLRRILKDFAWNTRIASMCHTWKKKELKEQIVTNLVKLCGLNRENAD